MSEESFINPSGQARLFENILLGGHDMFVGCWRASSL